MSVVVVGPDGPLTSTLAVIGQNPGKTEIDPNVLKPFAGYSGNLLKKWWTPLGIHREQTYVDNLIPFLCVPEKLKREEYLHWASELHRRLDRMPNLNVIVPTGDFACTALIGKGNNKFVPEGDRIGITKLRGSIYSYTTISGRQCKVIPTLHPSSLFVRGTGKMGVTKSVLEKRVVRDWQRIAKEVTTSTISEPQRNYYICRTEEHAKWFEDQVRQAAANASSIMSIDIETSDQLECVGFSFDHRWSFTFPTNTRDELCRYIPYITRICASPIAKVLQNGLYDTYWLRYYGVSVVNYAWDLMYLHGVLDPTNNHALDFLSSIYLPFHRYWKDEAKSPEELKKYVNNKEALYAYNGMDNCIQRELADYLIAEAQQKGLIGFYFSHVAAMLEPLLETALTGIRVDRGKMLAMREVSIARAVEVRRLLKEMAGEDLIAKSGFSPPRLQRYFHDKLGLPKIFKFTKKKEGKSKSVSLDATALAKLAHAYPAKALAPAQLIIDFRAEQKEQESWLNPDKLDIDDRVRCQYGTATEAGRLNSKSNPRGTGYNLQNTKTREKAWRRGGDKDSIRSIYLPDTGCVLLEVDLSQVEDRECKMYTRAPRMVEIANRHPADFDVHTHNAEIVFGNAFKPGDKSQRFLGKKVSHGAERGMTGGKLSDNLLAEEDMLVAPIECQKMIDTFLRENWEIRDTYFPWIRDQIMGTGYLVNSWGRVWDVREENLNDDLYRRGYSFLPQSEAADLMNQWGFIPVFYYLKCNWERLKACINVQRHDALIISVPFEHSWEVAKYTLDCLQRPREIRGNTLVVPATVKVGVNDAEGKEWKVLPDRGNFLGELEAYLKSL